MTQLLEKLISEIEKELGNCWIKNQDAVITKKVNELFINEDSANDAAISAQKYLQRKLLEKEAREAFVQCWENNAKAQITNQLEIFYNKIEKRHPWLKNEEKPAPPKLSLEEKLLSEVIKPLLFNSLVSKPMVLRNNIPLYPAKEWKDVLINDTTQFQWKTVDEKWTTPEIQGFPLSDASFYDDRLLPSYLESPFDQQPTRYDLYRLLKNTCKGTDKFSPKKLSNNVFCTRIAPLHHSELESLSKEEWDHFETILVNVGEELTPEWVILDKKQNHWTLYSPSFLQEKCQTILASKPAYSIETVEHPNMDKLTDWHAVLLSRVLPWCQLEANKKSPLPAYRSTIPTTLLFQNALESSCLPAQNKFITRSRKAFAKRAPLSTSDEKALYSDPTTQITCLFADIPETLASTVVSAFDERQISYDPDTHHLVISHSDSLLEALKLVYYYQVTSLTIRPNTAIPPTLKTWFDYNLTLRTIDAPTVSPYDYVHACAARNRFLARFKPNYLNEDNHTRSNAWKNTGRFIYDFFNQPPHDQAQSKNIAEMGEEGLKVFFDHLNTLTAPANLDCTLSLDSGDTLDVKKYIQLLANKISSYSGSNPLFRKLTLVLPKSLKESTDAFINLISALNARGEIAEVYFDNTAVIDHDFLDALDKFVEKNKEMRLQIKIPEWDESKCTDAKTSPLKAQYRELQNKILTNIRTARNNVLSANTASITNPSVALPLKTKHIALSEDKSWRKSVTYTLVSSAAAGVQQQAQQEVAQQAQQEAEQQSQPVKQPAAEMETYDGDESTLITRDNLEHYGIEEDDFSSWVGSTKDAEFITQRIDKSAWAQIKAFPSLFRFAIDGENTAGFKLYSSSKDKARILTYNAELAEKEIAKQKADPLSKPFAVQTNEIKPDTPFDGDYRQFSAFAEGNERITLWHYLATETVPQAIKDWLEEQKIGNTNTSESIQHYNVKPNIVIADNEAKMIEIIRQWSDISDNDFWQAFLEKFTPDNQRAFGQLFYHYGAEGNKQWMQLVHKIDKKFPGKFSIFKERLLDPLKDWSECLEKSEVDALTTSMEKLDKRPEYQNILWALINEHGKNVGRMRYAEVWNAYDEVIRYIDANDLQVNVEEFEKTIKNYSGKLNATQFLRRLSGVLQYTGNRQESQGIQQHILNNLSNIDWHENGFYYACVHENYYYWDESLELHHLDRLDGSKTASYIATWDDVDLATISNPMAYTLRYAAQKLKISKADFNDLKDILKQVSAKCPNRNNQIELMRLITASIALGFDSIKTTLKNGDWSTFNDPSYLDSLKRINQNLHLDSKELIGQSYHVRITDLPVLLDALSTAKIPPETLNSDTINALGRALQCYKGDKERLQTLIAYGMEHGFDHPLITAYPWLEKDPIENRFTDEERIKFYKQLSSIDFSTSTSKLPDKNQLNNILNGIHSKETRATAVDELIQSGCKITDQDAAFRVIGAHKEHLIDELFLAKTFQAENRELLKKLFKRLAIKEEGDSDQKIQKLLGLFSILGRKSYYDELGQLLGLLLEQPEDKYYSLEQLTLWLEAVFDENAFKKRPYPIEFISALLTDTLKDKNSSLLNHNLHQLKTRDSELDNLKTIIEQTNVSDLSAQAKQTLVEAAIEFKSEAHLTKTLARLNVILEKLKKSPRVTTSLCHVITAQLTQNAAMLVKNLDIIEKLTEPYSGSDTKLKTLWESTQVKLLDSAKTQATIDEKSKQLIYIENPLIRMIVIDALSEKDDINLIQTIQKKLGSLDKDYLDRLAHYYTSEPKPTLAQLDTLLDLKSASFDEMIHYFEAHIQATDPETNQSKRYYSIDPEDAENLERVLSGIKLKQQPLIAQSEQVELLHLLYYLNTYSSVMQLEAKSNDALLDDIHENLETIRQNKTDGKEASEAQARVLACMREMVLRKTGKWLNHTQMMALLYSVLHDDDNLLHQIHTGEGKSLITVMRVAYRALNGQVVDVFSSKESLSTRDHQVSLAVLDAFEIRNNHITANSGPEQYYNKVNDRGVGAVHYSTAGNWALFLSGIRWDDKDAANYIDIHAPNRVVFLDEGDYILLAENTLFNFSDQMGSDSIFNFDAWVYRVTYDFYLKHELSFTEQEFVISEDPDLMSLYKTLEDSAQKIAPTESSFFQKYLASGDETLRNQKLVYLLKAAHQAKKLKQNVNFCVMNEQKKIGDGAILNTRFAKVMIDNQVYNGSTYSDLVQQFLHVRLNKEAVKKGERPNFFIEPESEIVLSLNAAYILKHYYKHIEACTGTAGNEETVKFYKDEFGINRVIKVPTHQEIKTQFLAPIYCKDEQTQIEQIVASILENNDRPILLTCEDDDAVERLGKQIEAALKAKGIDRPLMMDTNAKGLSEADILKKAGCKGALTISSRLGRGSDIKPYDKDIGLKVIRTYAAIASIVKQEQGRQGRNNFYGECQDILNYGAIELELEKYKDDAEFKKLLDYETKHLDVKLKKHEKLNKTNKVIWKEIRESTDLRNQYLNTRTLQQYKHNLKEAEKRRAQQKDELLIEGSAQVISHLRHLSAEEKVLFKAEWKTCRKAIEIHWTDQDQQASRTILDTFYTKNNIQKPKLPEKKSPSIHPYDDKEKPVKEFMLFQQSWLKSLRTSCFKLKKPIADALYGEKSEHLDSLYKLFKSLDVKQLNALSDVVAKHPACHTVDCLAWCHVIELIKEDTDDNLDNYVDRLNTFFKENHSFPQSVEEVKKRSVSFKEKIEGKPNIDFLEKAITENAFQDDERTYLFALIRQFDKKVVDVCRNFIYEEDVVFLLEQCVQFKSDQAAVHLNSYFKKHIPLLTAHSDIIRPLIPLALQNNPSLDDALTLFPVNENYDDKTAALLYFLNQRPDFDPADYQALKEKIQRILPENQLTFLISLSKLPAYLSVKNVLKDFNKLPGTGSFKASGLIELQKHIETVHKAMHAFNDFLFDHGIISDKDSFDNKRNREKYDEWQALFTDIPLNKREVLFTELKEIKHIELTELKGLVDSYVTNPDNQTLYQTVHDIQYSESSRPQGSDDASKARVNNQRFFKKQPQTFNKKEDKLEEAGVSKNIGSGPTTLEAN